MIHPEVESILILMQRFLLEEDLGDLFHVLSIIQRLAFLLLMQYSGSSLKYIFAGKSASVYGALRTARTPPLLHKVSRRTLEIPLA